MKKQKFQPRFLVNEHGKTEAVQLDIKAYEALMEELEDTHDVKRAEKILAKKAKTYTLTDSEIYYLGKGKKRRS